MERLRNFIKLMLYRKGYLQAKTTEEKLDRLLVYITKLDLYSRYFSNITQSFLEKDIVAYIEELERILIYTLDSKLISVRSITPESHKELPYSYWYTYNGIILNDKDMLKLWLEKARAFVVWCDTAKTDFNNTVRINNFRKLAPYYNNIINITDDLYYSILKKI